MHVHHKVHFLTYFQLSNKRRVGVSQFRKACLINIREYYEKDGKMLPGKKVDLIARSHSLHLGH